jgi:hypothetical protein
MPFIIKYSSAPCGAGKTHQIIQAARKLVEEGRYVLLLQPTTDLIDQTKADYFDNTPNAPSVKVFHAKIVGENVAKQLAKYLAQPEDRPQIVFATHQVLPRIPFLPCAKDWDLIIDETIQVDKEQSHVVPKTHAWLTDHLEIEQHDGVYGKVSIKRKSALVELARNQSQDELLDRFRETASILVSRSWDCFVNIEHYHRLLDGKSERLTIHAILNSSIVRRFASVFIAAANFEDSGMYHLWSKQGVSFREDEGFAEGFRFRQHPNGQLTTIHYAVERNWSRNLLNQKCEGGPPLELLRDAAYPIIGRRQFLWQANKSVPDNFMPRAQRLPNNPLGLNVFSTVHDVVFLSALNPSPAHYKFLQQQGLTSEQIDRQGYCSVGYQAVMRSSLREPSNEDPKNIIVPDRRLAEYLAEALPGSTVRKLDAGIGDAILRRGRKRKHASSSERSRSHRQKEKEKRLELLRQLFVCNRAQDEKLIDCNPDGSTKLCNEIPIKLYSNFVTQHGYFATMYSDIKSATPTAYLSCRDQDAFIAAMAICHSKAHQSKEAIGLFSPAIFDPTTTNEATKPKSTRRGLANIVYLQNLVLDFEEGDLRPEQIPELFPDLKMIVTNTYRHTAEEPRFRVIILTAQCTTPEVYEALFDAVEAKLREAGYVGKPRSKSKHKKSGLDRSKRSAASLFYLPCQAECADQSFFEVYNGPERRPLDPKTWILNVSLATRLHDEKQITEHGEVDIDHTRSDSAISRWRGASPGYGNREFYLFALELRKIGVPNFEIQSTLAREAHFSRSPKQRNDQIPSIMKSLSKGDRALSGL